MLIKGISHNILNDAPFIGALVIAPFCYKGCKSCQNDHLKLEDNIEISATEIISQVKENLLDEGIILGGLEWTYTPRYLRELINLALSEGLEVMLYTYMTEDEFRTNFPDIYVMPIWVKFGEYDELKKTSLNNSFGVQLATSNQYIKKLG